MQGRGHVLQPSLAPRPPGLRPARRARHRSYRVPRTAAWRAHRLAAAVAAAVDPSPRHAQHCLPQRFSQPPTARVTPLPHTLSQPVTAVLPHLWSQPPTTLPLSQTPSQPTTALQTSAAVVPRSIGGVGVQSGGIRSSVAIQACCCCAVRVVCAARDGFRPLRACGANITGCRCSCGLV